MRTYEIRPGTPIEVACVVVYDKVTETGEPHKFEFNGVNVEVHEGMTVDDIMEKAFQGKVKLERYNQAKFEHDLRTAISKALPDIDYYDNSAMNKDVDKMFTAIRPFLRTP